MKTNERILRINSVLRDYFAKHPQSGMILAKEFMPLFIKNGIFNKDNREGLPIRKVLRDLDTENSLDKIPYVHTERKPKTINWYFQTLEVFSSKHSFIFLSNVWFSICLSSSLRLVIIPHSFFIIGLRNICSTEFIGSYNRASSREL